MLTTSEHYARCERERLPGESLLDSVQRHAFEDLFGDTGSQEATARLLGCSQQRVSQALRLARERRVDGDLGIIRKRGPRAGTPWSPARREQVERQRRERAERELQEAAR